jgi:hypothetical protein
LAENFLSPEEMLCEIKERVTVAPFEFIEWTPNNHLRHRFIGLREGQNARGVTRQR